MASTLVGAICIKHYLSGSGIGNIMAMPVNYNYENVTFRLITESIKSSA
ncbi:hypothetical protein PPBDW_II0324 [Photobacterium kishitanii]|nr:hypothetical protein PPBDW_II0324 [Photobacterium kishitanii]